MGVFRSRNWKANNTMAKQKGKTRDQKSTTTKYTEKSRLRNTNPTNKGSELGCSGRAHLCQSGFCTVCVY